MLKGNQLINTVKSLPDADIKQIVLFCYTLLWHFFRKLSTIKNLLGLQNITGRSCIFARFVLECSLRSPLKVTFNKRNKRRKYI